MPRKKLVRTPDLPYHVTARANNRERFPVNLSELWEIFGEECLFLNSIYNVEFQAFVMMPNHIHAILTIPSFDLGKVMNELMKSVSRRTNTASGRSGHLWGGPYYWSLIQGTRYFGHALKYVYRNPVRANLCERVEDYRFSTLSGLLGNSNLQIPVHLTRVGMEINLPSIDPWEQLEWLNRPFPKEAEELIKKGLRKKVFDSIIDRKNRSPSVLLDGLL